MRIAINALSVTGGGGLTFLKNLLRWLPLVGPDNEYMVLATKATTGILELDNGAHPGLRSIICPAYGWVGRGCWEQLMMPRLLRMEGVDVLYAPGNQGPVLSPCPFVVLIQNVDPLNRGMSGVGLGFECKRKIARLMMRASIRRARRTIAISEYTRRLLVREFRLSSQKVAVVPHGSPKNTEVLADSELLCQLRKVGIAAPYFLSVSNIKYNKNYENLVVAFAVAQREMSEPVHLAIAGEVEHRRSFLRVQNLIRENGASARIHFLGKVDPKTLQTLYAGSLGLIFPSMFESFGLPPLEAMAYGVPVAASRIEPVVEVCGDAVLYFDPEDPEEMAEAMVKVMRNAELRKTLVERGLLRAKLFSWERTARRTLELLHEAAGLS